MSDPIEQLKAVPTAATLAAVLAVARERYTDCTHVVWTGDLSHDLSVEGYRMLRDQLDDWFGRSSLIPGNHDDRQTLRHVFPEVGGSGDDCVGFVTEVAGWRLVGLDSQVPGEVAGALGDSEIARVERCLGREPHRPTLLFVHHPPGAIGSSWLDALGLAEPQRLERLVRRYPAVRGIFCGHVHQVFEGTFAGVPFFTAPSTAFQFKPGTYTAEFDAVPPGFRVIWL